jgi:acetoin utilization deacetylase AcuC-like enzyme
MFSFISDARCALHENNGFETCDRFLKLDAWLRNSNHAEIKLKQELKPESQLDLEKAIVAVHDPDFITKIKELCASEYMVDGVDLNKNSYTSILASVESVITAIENIHFSKSKYIFCNIRPPGHHASFSSGGGNCVINNIVCGAKYALNRYKKIVVIDWDLHLGNGTYELVEKFRNPNIKYYSIHQAKIYPKSTLKSNALSTTPYSKVYSMEKLDLKQYIEIFSEIMADVKDYSPNLILLSCGFDACVYEMFAHNFPLKPQDYYDLTTKIKKLDIPTVSVLEGGYDTNMLEQCLSFHVKGFL